MRLFAVLLISALAAGAARGEDSERGPVNFQALHLRMSPPRGWKLNDSMSKDGWVSLYWLEAKDPVESSIDVFFYAKNTPLGSQDKYLAKLQGDDRLKNLATKAEKINGRDALTAVSDSDRTVAAYSTNARRAAFRETHMILSRPDGIVVLRLQATKALHKKQEAVLRKLAQSVESL